MMFSLASMILLAAPAVAVGAEPPPESPIIGGETVEKCAYPAALSLESPSTTCSGSLIHPQVVLTAAHCGDMSEVHFGESWQPAARTVQITQCHANPGWSGNFSTGTDFQYCLLAAAVHDVPVVPIAMGCELDILTSGREVVAVGFGRTQDQVNDYGVKRAVTMALGAANMQAGTAWVPGVGGKSTCSGDSGGPLYVRMSSDAGGDDSWRLVGINSWKSGSCSNGTGFVLANVAVPWIEAHSGIDVTPCHESDGNWVPGPNCGWFQTEIGLGHGAWPSCDQGPKTGPSSLCGPPVSGEDLVPPLVSIVNPVDGATLDPIDGFAAVKIVVEADDGDGWGVDEVYLVVNGTADESNSRRTPPYEWNGDFPKGVHTLVAVAVDRAGLEGEAQVTFGVGVDPPATGGEPTGGDGTQGSGGTGGNTGDGTGPGSGDDGTAGASAGLSGGSAGDPGAASGCGCRAPLGPAWPSAGPAAMFAFLLRPRRRPPRCVSR